MMLYLKLLRKMGLNSVTRQLVRFLVLLVLRPLME
jgi:hypothetical protein